MAGVSVPNKCMTEEFFFGGGLTLKCWSLLGLPYANDVTATITKHQSYLQRQQDLRVALAGKRLWIQSGIESFQGLGQGLCIHLELH